MLAACATLSGMPAEAARLGHQGAHKAPLVAVPPRAPQRVTLGHLRLLSPLLRPSEAFALLGISRSTGYAWIRRGSVPTVEIGGCLWVPTAVLAEQLFGIPAEVLLSSEEEGER